MLLLMECDHYYHHKCVCSRPEDMKPLLIFGKQHDGGESVRGAPFSPPLFSPDTEQGAHSSKSRSPRRGRRVRRGGEQGEQGEKKTPGEKNMAAAAAAPHSKLSFPRPLPPFCTLRPDSSLFLSYCGSSLSLPLLLYVFTEAVSTRKHCRR